MPKNPVPYNSMKTMAPNKCHKMLFVTETSHPLFGFGQQATVECTDGRVFRVQLPKKYMSKLSAEEVSALMQDMESGKNPYLIYREFKDDKFFRLDIVKKSRLSVQHFCNGTDFPELNDLVDESEEHSYGGHDGNNEEQDGNNEG